MKKARDAFRTISEAATELDLPQHVLRHWEDCFGAIRPMRRAGGRRYYRLQDIELLCGVKVLLHDRGFTTKGVQKIFADRGSAHIAELGRQALIGDNEGARPLVEIDRQTVEDLLARLQGLRSDMRELRRTITR
ncbi:MAG: MerR family transcriptional regulator [Pseudomonadota bacterium]